MGSITNLQVNIPYLLFTKKETIMAERVKVVGILNYEQANDINYSIITLAINEKVIEKKNEPDATENYLKAQFFYKCKGLDKNGAETDKIFLVWDDVIDTIKTTQLMSTYTYKLTLQVNTNLDMPINEACNAITNNIRDMFNGMIEAEMKQIEIIGQNDYKALLDDYMSKFEDAKTVINKLAALKQIETLIEILSSGMIVENMNKIAEKQEEILTVVGSISDMIK